MISHSAIAVYNPSDAWERAIQDASKEYTDDWLTMYRCKLMAHAVASLKSIDDWMLQPDLYGGRAKYFFAPHFAGKKDRVVFVTHLLFLRDILENREINAYIHDPVVFVTPPIAHYLLREYPIHIVLDYETLKSENNVNLMEIGGLLIADGENVKVSKECVIDISVKNDYRLQQSVEPGDVQSIVMQTGMKAAAKQLFRGVFSIEDHHRAFVPGMKVWDKEKRQNGNIYLVEPGDTGIVGVQYDDGNEITISKLFFDNRFAIV